MNEMTLERLTNLLDNTQQVTIKRGVLRSASFFSKIKRFFHTDFRRQQDIAVMSLVIETLQSSPRVTPAEAYNSREVCILREWITRNRITLERSDEKLFKDLKTEFTAYRLGITSQNLAASPELQQFTDKKAFLYNYLAFYEHTLKTESDHSPVQILMGGKYVPWEKAKTAVVDQPDAPGVWPWKYGEHGLKNDDFGDWQDPLTRGYRIKKHPFPGKHLFTYCAFCALKAPRYSGEHSWIRLTTPDGMVYEFGKYRPPRVWKLEKALVNFPAVIQSPDMNTMWPVCPQVNPPIKHCEGTTITQIHFEISENDFKKALEKIQSIKQRKNLTFGLFDDSCVVMDNEVAAECGIQLETGSSMLKLYFPLSVIKAINASKKYLPKIVVEMIYYIPAVLTNIMLCLFLGARARYTPGAKRHINSLWDLFNPEKSILHHPWYLAAVVGPEVEAKRPAGKPFGIPEK